MTREDILQEILSLKGNNWLLELPTGFGKSKIAIEKIKQLKAKNILLVVNRIVHKQNWEEEFNKWWKDRDVNITMTTYVSLPKYAGNYDVCIFDESHHLSERCRKALSNFNIKYSILLSATVGKFLKEELKKTFKGLIVYKKTLRNAIDNDILPDPQVYLLPLHLGNSIPTETILKNTRSKGRVIETSWATRWNYLKQKQYPIKIYCTQKQYLIDLNRQIEFWKTKYLRGRSEIAKHKWLRLCNNRLRWLSDKKVSYIQKMLCYFDKCRTLIFCNSIEQTEKLGEYCINSKNKDSVINLKLFNEYKINHITACNILNEGMNLVDCQIGIYANLNSSETIIKQRMGRLLRHKEPILIIPYFKDTREEELVKNMLENYNPQFIHVVDNYKDIKI